MTIKRVTAYNYSPAHRVFEVAQGKTVLGIVENWEGRIEWKAFSGSGFSCRYLRACRSREAAVTAVVEATANLE